MNKKLVLIAALSALLFLLVMYLLRDKGPEYRMRPEEALAVCIEGHDLAMPGDSGQYIDVRPPSEFVKGHLEGAINIPYQNILSESNRAVFDRLRDEKLRVILYGAGESQARDPYLLLLQLGYDNLKVLAGGYPLPGNDTLTALGLHSAEEALTDFALAARPAASPVANAKPPAGPGPAPAKKVEPKPVQPSAPAEGGC